MKYFLVVCAFFLMEEAKAQTIGVGNVKVSVKADSAASAREQALNQAHKLAFQKLVSENFPESASPLPSEDILKDMVSGFSIDREKTTSTSYTASLTFEFDEPQLLGWIQQGPRGQQAPSHLPFGDQSPRECGPLILTASYQTHGEWQHIRKTLENSPGVQNLSISSLSAKNASMRLIYGGNLDKLQQVLLQKGVLLSQQGDDWVVSSNEQALH